MEQGKINEQIVDAMLSRFGRYRAGGNKNNVGPMLPYILMDAQYMLYWDRISTLNFNWVGNKNTRANLLYTRSKWHEAYTDFNKSVGRSWNDEQKVYVGDMLDSLEDYIRNDLMTMKVGITNRIDHLEFEHQDVLATVVICNILAQYAQVCWKVVFKDCNMNSQKNNKIQDVVYYSQEFEDTYGIACNNKKHINLNEDKQFSTSVDILAKKMIDWMRNYK